jgi:hypothetical protein
MWHKYQDILLDHLGGRDIIVGGDARCDSPGYSAKYGSYTIMNLDERIILDLQLVQVLTFLYFVIFFNFILSKNTSSSTVIYAL